MEMREGDVCIRIHRNDDDTLLVDVSRYSEVVTEMTEESVFQCRI